jgi:Flp pilus assembly protein protease CpaA
MLRPGPPGIAAATDRGWIRPMTQDSASLASAPLSAVAPRQGGCAPVSWPVLWTVLLALAALGATAALVLIGPAPVPAAGSPSHAGYFLLVLTVLIATLAAWFDAATTRIPNPLTYTALALGLILNLVQSIATSGHQSKLTAWLSAWLGAPGVADGLFGLALCGGIGLICLLFAGMGGGDMKLLTAFGVLLGFGQVRAVLVWALVAALPYAIVNLLVLGRLNRVLKVASLLLLSCVYLRQPAAVETPSKTSVPLAVPLLAGLLLAQAFPGILGW